MTDFESRREEKMRRREERRHMWETRMQSHDGQGHVWTGAFLLVIGAVALAKSMGVAMPRWLFTWQMLLIVIGLFIGFRKGFRDGGWFVPVLIGGIFLLNQYYLNGQLHRHLWPLILIIVGAFFVFRAGSRKPNKWKKQM